LPLQSAPVGKTVVLDWIDAHPHESFLAIVTIGEIFKRHPSPSRRETKRGLMRWVKYPYF
jgi:hypothetical protein